MQARLAARRSLPQPRLTPSRNRGGLAGLLRASLHQADPGDREFADLIAAADVFRITIHGLCHTCAMLLLAAGVPWHVVQKRPGDKDASTTMDVYSHVLPDQQRDAARKLASLLHRK